LVPLGATGVVSVTTDGGTSEVLVVGPTIFSGIEATATVGAPAVANQPSANPGQRITILGAGLNNNTHVIFPTRDDNGVAGNISVRVQSSNGGGASATVSVPDGAVTGDVSLFGTSGKIRLQIVPQITSYSNGDFFPSGTNRYLQITGHGFSEGNTNFLFGSTTVADPDTGPNTVDVFYSGTYANTIIPNNGQGSLRVQTGGGTSNAIAVGPTAFTGIQASAALGTPANAGQPSANTAQEITLLGANFGANTNVLFTRKDDNGVVNTINVRVKNVAADRTSATVEAPYGAVTGNVSVFGVSGAQFLQIVPALSSFSVGDFRPSGASRNLTLYGGGFVEGALSIKFGDVTTVDPDTGPNTIDVYGTARYLATIIPNNAKGMVQIITNGGTSNSLPVGPTAFTGLSAVAATGVPSTTAQPSANVGQMIVVHGANLNANSNVFFTSMDDNGVVGATPVRVQGVAADGASANVEVPNGATTGNVTLFGATGSFHLQIVPTLHSYSLGDFRPSGASRNLTIYGGGFAEGKSIINFGNVAVVDPDTGSATVDVYSSGTAFNTVIPNNAQSLLTVRTAGGLSAPLAVGPTGFTAIASTANLGTATNAGQASANVQQVITLHGANLTADTNVLFPTVDDNGVPGTTYVRVQAVGAANTWATVVVPYQATTGNVSLFGAPGSFALQIVPFVSAFGYSTFSSGNNLALYGGGFVEGAITTTFGAVNVVDPSTGSNQLDVYSSGSGLNVTIPTSPGVLVTVQTAGGTSNAQHMTDPNVALLAPKNGANLANGLPLELAALADDNSGIQYVDFLVNGSVIVSDTSAPYQATYTPMSNGALTIGARARAMDGATASANVAINVVAPTLTISATAAVGAPANAGQPSANGRQRITVISQNFNDNSQIVFPMLNSEGAPYTDTVRISNLSADATWATVEVPNGAVTGDLRLLGANATSRLQIVPTLTSFSLSDFRPSGASRNLALRGSGFVEGSLNLLFGNVTLSDLDIGPETIDVYYSDNSGLNSVIPANAQGNLRMQTAGGLSNVLYVGPTAFSGLRSVAAIGAPADADQPSANVGQRITISGTHLNPATNVVFTSINGDGVEATDPVRVESVNATGTAATVIVPLQAKSGALRVEGATGSFSLQIVPVLTTFSNDDFAPSGDSRNLTLRGSGFVEGAITVHYGDGAVVDPDTGYNILDVYSYGDYLNVVIPENAKGNVTVTTSGGASNILHVGPTSFASIQGVAALGSPAVNNQPSANVDQFITIIGANLGENSNVLFSTVNDEGVNTQDYVRVSTVSADHTRAAVRVPPGAATGNVSLFGAPGTAALQIVPTINGYYNADFLPSGTSRSLQLEGNGFVEGLSSVTFGDVVQNDLDNGENIIDVWNAGRLLYTVIPDNAKGLGRVTTAGGVSNPFAVGPTAFTGVEANAQQGEAATVAEPSANVGQLITIRGEHLNPNTNVIFPTVDDSGVPASDAVRISGTSADGRSATVEVPYGATTGNIQVGGVGGAFRLQIVPVIDEFSFSSFAAGDTLYLTGRGFIEGSNNVRFGSVLVSDPDTGSFQVDSWGGGSRLYVTIPDGAQSRLRVSTPGGASNSLEIAPPEPPTEYPQAAQAPTGPRLFVAPDGDFSTIVENVDGAFVRTLKDGAQMHFNAAGLQTATVDRNGNTTTFGYDGNLRLTSITDPVGLKTTFTYANNRVATISDPANRVTKFSYDAAGNLVSITDPDNSVRYFGYDTRHRLTSQTSKRGFVTQYQYNFAGMHIKSLWPDGSTRVITPALAIGLVNLASGVGNAANPAPVVRPEEMVAKFQDGEGRVTTYETGRYGEATRIIDPAGLVTRIERDEDGNPIRITLPTGNVYSRTFDATGNLLTLLDSAVNGTTHYVYDPAFNLITATTDPFNQVTTIQRDNRGNLTQISSPLGRDVVYTYDSRGLSTTMTDPWSTNTAYVYNSLGLLTSSSQGNGAAQRPLTFTYTPAGYPASITDPLGRAFSFNYDAVGRLTSESLPGSRTVAYHYNADGDLTGITPPGRPMHSFEYNRIALLTAYVPPAVAGSGATRTIYEYNRDQQVTKITRPDGQVLTYGYDNSGRLNTLTTPRGAYGYSYSATTGHLTSLNAPGNVNLTYGYTGELLTGVIWSGAVAGSVSYVYDANYRTTSLAVNGNAITFQYDADDALTRVGDLQLTYDANRGLLTGSTLGTVSDSYTYNVFAELNSYNAKVGNNALYSTSYSRDKLGRITAKTETIGGLTTVYSYTYNVAGHLSQVQENGVNIAIYTYDANGNRVSFTNTSGATVNGAYDEQDRLLQYGGATYSYTANGELLEKTNGGQTTTYNYDVLGNLVAVSLQNGMQIEYVVDGQHRRIGKRVNGAFTQGWLYQDDLKPVAELDSQGNVVSRFVYGSRDNIPDLMVKGGATYRLIADHLGSVRLVVDIQTGAVVQRIDYDAFGRVLQDTNPRFQPFGFVGGLYDTDTGLVRFGARDYDAEVGRWTAKDPLGFEGGDINLYTYVDNNPQNYTDPTGEFINVLIGAGASVLAGWAIAKLTGSCYSWKDALIDAGTGALGVGALNKLRQLSRLNRLRKIAADAGMAKTAVQKGMEKYVGSNYARIEIKHVGNVFKPTGGFNPQTSWIPRARVRAAAGTYIDPFTGKIGPKHSDVAHIPLELLPLTEAPAVGAGIGGASSAARSGAGCECD
jgi:RHS repeat-associated protein